MANAWTALRRRAAKNGATAQTDGLENALRLRLRLGTEGRSARRLPAPLRRRPLALAGGLLVLIALVGYLAAYRSASDRAGVLVAAHDLSAGHTLTGSDVRVARLAADRLTLAALIPGSDRDLVVGRVLPAAVAAGVPLSRTAVSAAGGEPAAFTLVVPALNALGGALQPGDRISVLATFDQADGQTRTRPVARHLRVLAVGQPPAGLDQASATIPVTVALPDAALASALALANQAGKIDLLRDSPTQTAAPIPAAGEGGR